MHEVCIEFINKFIRTSKQFITVSHHIQKSLSFQTYFRAFSIPAEVKIEQFKKSMFA